MKHFNNSVPWGGTLGGMIAVIVAIVGAFSPIIAAFALLLTYPFVPQQNRLPRTLVSLMFALMIAVIYSSRQTFSSPFDDFSNVYYPWYNQLKDYGIVNFFTERFNERFSVSHLEIAAPFILYIFALIPGKLTAAALILLVTLFGGALYVWWLEHYFLPDISPNIRNYTCALCMGLFAFGLCSQTLRQMWSIPFLLAAIWEPRISRKLLLIAIAGAFHESSIMVASLAWTISANKRTGALVVGIIVVLSITYSSRLGGLFVGDDPAVMDKAQYYTQLQHDAAPIDLKYLPVMLGVTFIALFARRYRHGTLTRITVVFLALYIFLLPLPLASYRITLFITTALIGPIIAVALAPRAGPRLMLTAALTISLVMLGRRAYTGWDDLGMGLWRKFPAVGAEPFYYLTPVLAP